MNNMTMDMGNAESHPQASKNAPGETKQTQQCRPDANKSKTTAMHGVHFTLIAAVLAYKAKVATTLRTRLHPMPRLTNTSNSLPSQ